MAELFIFYMIRESPFFVGLLSTYIQWEVWHSDSVFHSVAVKNKLVYDSDSFLHQEQLRRTYNLHLQWATKFAGKCKALCTRVTFFLSILKHIFRCKGIWALKNPRMSDFLTPDFFLEHSWSIFILQGQNEKWNHKNQTAINKCVHALFL